MRGLILLLALSWPCFGAGAWVQTTQTAGTAASAGTVAAPAQSNTTGNLLVVFINFTDVSNVINVTGIADTAGNTYTPGTRFNSGSNNGTSQMWYAKNIVGNASNVVTATLSASTTFRSPLVSEYSGLDTSTPLDVEIAPRAQASSTTLTSSTFTTVPNDMVVMMVASSPPFTPGSGYAMRGFNTTPAGNYAGSEDQHFATAQTGVTAIFTAVSGAQTANIHGMAFKDQGAVTVTARHRIINQ
jgi:hypothetical protein